MPLFAARKATLVGNELIYGAQVQVLDPNTGEKIDGVMWADTDWAMLKTIVHEPTTGGGKRFLTESIGVKGRFEIQMKAKYVRRDFNLVDRKTGKLLFCVSEADYRARDYQSP